MSVFDPVAWAALAEKPVLEVGATVFAYLVAVRLFRRSGNHPLLNHPDAGSRS